MTDKLVQTLEAVVPQEVMLKPVDALAPGEVLGRLSLSAARNLLRIVEQPLIMGNPAEGEAGDLKQQRLVGDLSLGALRLGAQVQGSALRAQTDERIAQILETIYREREKKTDPVK